jgi:signal transduction histidine kinase
MSNGGWRRLKVDARWRIAAASASVGLLMCGALVLTIFSHGESVRAGADAHHLREKTLVTAGAVAAFWKECDGMDAYLAFPRQRFADQVRDREVSVREALGRSDPETTSERALVGRASAANEQLIVIFNEQLFGGIKGYEGARRMRAAELSVLAPLAQLAANNRRDYLEAEAVAASAEQAGFRSAWVISLLGLGAIVWFAFFAVRLVRRIEKQNVELQLADVEKDDFIGTVSHELRTPLTSMSGYVELLLEDDADPLTRQQRDFLATVQRGSLRLERLINDLLLMAQVHAGRLDIQKNSTDLVEIVRQTVESAQAHAGRKALQLSLTAPSDPIFIEGDDVRLSQALDNVISNAIKFTPEDGRIDVMLTQRDGRVSVTVADTGMGMTAGDIDRLFERFFRADSARAKGIQGTGLGMSIVKAIVEAHDGTITVTSQPNVGTSFGISLPVAAPFERQASSHPRTAPLAA